MDVGTSPAPRSAYLNPINRVEAWLGGLPDMSPAKPATRRHGCSISAEVMAFCA
jgi:hypothetical protein